MSPPSEISTAFTKTFFVAIYLVIDHHRHHQTLSLSSLKHPRLHKPSLLTTIVVIPGSHHRHRQTPPLSSSKTSLTTPVIIIIMYWEAKLFPVRRPKNPHFTCLIYCLRNDRCSWLIDLRDLSAKNEKPDSASSIIFIFS